MGRPNRLPEQRERLLPVIAGAFVELGFRRATTAKLARCCGVRENILYRLWDDKKAMFLAAIRHVFESSEDVWGGFAAKERAARGQPTGSTAERLLDHESRHHGELGNYRLLFSALGELDDPEIRAVVAETYQRFFGFVRDQVGAHRTAKKKASVVSDEVVAWAIIGLGTAANISRELGLLDGEDRQQLLGAVAKGLL